MVVVNVRRGKGVFGVGVYVTYERKENSEHIDIVFGGVERKIGGLIFFFFCNFVREKRKVYITLGLINMKLHILFDFFAITFGIGFVIIFFVIYKSFFIGHDL